MFARAQSDSTNPYDPFDHPTIMLVAYLNTDCVSDTVYGYLTEEVRWLPSYVYWGQLYDSAGNARCDSGKYDIVMAKSDRRDTTDIVLPNWGELTCDVSVQQLNTNDTLSVLLSRRSRRQRR